MFDRFRAAFVIMRSYNKNMQIGKEGGLIVGIEDHFDEPGGRLFRLEFQSTPCGKHANAWVRYNPWGGVGNPSAGVSYVDGHVGSDGFLCIGNAVNKRTAASPYNLDFTIKRARFWCTAFSHWRQTGDASVFDL